MQKTAQLRMGGGTKGRITEMKVAPERPSRIEKLVNNNFKQRCRTDVKKFS